MQHRRPRGAELIRSIVGRFIESVPPGRAGPGDPGRPWDMVGVDAVQGQCSVELSGLLHLPSFRVMSNPQASPCGFWSRTKVSGMVRFPNVSFLIDPSPSRMASVVGGSGRLAPAFSRSLPETHPHTAW